ncbi:MAG: hypothetical protein ABI675_00580 [Chitinophagaceae bacterium]
MNKKVYLAAAITSMILLSSCLTSLQRLVTYSTVTTDNRIIGNWQYEGLPIKIESIPGSHFYNEILASFSTTEEKKSVYESKEDSMLYTKSYVVDFIKKGYRYYMACSLIRLGNDIFADIEPIDAKPLNNPTTKDVDDLFHGGTYISSHSIAKVVFREKETEFRFLNSDFILDQLKNGRVSIKYEKDDLFQTNLITSSSKDLQQFLAKYGNDERLYSKENTVTLKKI